MKPNADDRDQYDALCDRLMVMLRKGFGGSSNPVFVAEVKRLTEDARRIADDSYVSEKARNLVNWVEIACSPRKHAQWGIDRVEHFAYEDAHKMKSWRRG